MHDVILDYTTLAMYMISVTVGMSDSDDRDVVFVQ